MVSLYFLFTIYVDCLEEKRKKRTFYFSFTSNWLNSKIGLDFTDSDSNSNGQIQQHNLMTLSSRPIFLSDFLHKLVSSKHSQPQSNSKRGLSFSI